jgi:hypothetical protein
MKIRQLASPSECARDPSKVYTHPATLAGRPLGGRGLPVALYNSHLAVLTDAFANLDSMPAPSAWTLKRAMEIIRISLDFYNVESERQTAIKVVIDQVFPGAVWQKTFEGAIPDTVWAGAVLELKNEAGLGGNPTAQAIGDYEKFVDHATVRTNCLLDLPSI